MGNIISLHKEYEATSEWLKMSNGMTDVFIAVLAISGSMLASTPRQKELIIWLAEHDQSSVGMGTVGFALSEMPWTQAGFVEEKHFLLQVVASAQAQTGWNILDYTPHENIFECLGKFSHLLATFDEQYVDEEYYRQWLAFPAEYAPPVGFPLCPQHQVLLHWAGCIVCHDAGL